LVQKEEHGPKNISKVLIAVVQRGSLKNNIVNMVGRKLVNIFKRVLKELF
jgi:hypothetical protein